MLSNHVRNDDNKLENILQRTKQKLHDHHDGKLALKPQQIEQFQVKAKAYEKKKNDALSKELQPEVSIFYCCLLLILMPLLSVAVLLCVDIVHIISYFTNRHYRLNESFILYFFPLCKIPRPFVVVY
jgi:hypothetical protein